MNRSSVVTTLLASFALAAPVFAEALGDTEFAFDEIWAWEDTEGEPGEGKQRVDITAISRGQVELVAWNDAYEMMLIDFGDGRTGWVKKSDIIPPPSMCAGASQVRTASRATGGNTNSVQLVSRGLAEKACQ